MKAYEKMDYESMFSSAGFVHTGWLSDKDWPPGESFLGKLLTCFLSF